MGNMHWVLAQIKARRGFLAEYQEAAIEFGLPQEKGKNRARGSCRTAPGREGSVLQKDLVSNGEPY